jgi:hypothetical protein
VKKLLIALLLIGFVSASDAKIIVVKKTTTSTTGKLLKTMQTTSYHVGDDGDSQAGLSPSYTVSITGAQSGTANVDLPHLASNAISFNAQGIKSSARLGSSRLFLQGIKYVSVEARRTIACLRYHRSQTPQLLMLRKQ